MDGEFRLGVVALGLLGGLALFLYGLEHVTAALKEAAGERLRSILTRLTARRAGGVLTGAILTAVIQSSSVTTVLLVGFVSAGLMTLRQSIPVILGADIGTTVTAQIVAFQVTELSLLLVVAGFALYFAARRGPVKRYGMLVLGLGLVFYGMQMMGEAAAPLRGHPPFLRLLRSLEDPLAAVAASALFTAVIQSSAATIGVILVMAAQGFLSLEAGIALVFGANIGTCVTALLAAIGRPREAVRVAVVHVLFKIAGVLLWIGFLEPFARLVRALSPELPDLAGPERLAGETPRQIANAHTVFNVANMLLFVGFVDPIARLMTRVVPRHAREAEAAARPVYLDPVLLATPQLALDRARLELERLGDWTLGMLRDAREVVLHGGEAELDRLAARDEEADLMHRNLVDYVRRLAAGELTKAASRRLHVILSAANDLENLGDLVATSLVDIGRKRLRDGVTMSPETREVLGGFAARMEHAMADALRAYFDADHRLARSVLDAKEEVRAAAEHAENHIAARLVAEEPGRLALFRIESDLVGNLKRVYTMAKRLARLVEETPEKRGAPRAAQ